MIVWSLLNLRELPGTPDAMCDIIFAAPEASSLSGTLEAVYSLGTLLRSNNYLIFIAPLMIIPGCPRAW
jgi:hypothetical protein